MNRKFSIVIPVYNSQKYIKTAMQSIINQTYNNLELIVINDGSADESENIIFDIIDKNKQIDIKYKKIENSGPSIARNIGLNMATGDFICFLDSDDSYDVNTFTLLNNVQTDYDACYFGWNEINTDNKIIGKYEDKFKFFDGVINGVEAVKLKFYFKIWVNNCNCVYNLKLLKDNNVTYPKNIYAGEDGYFIFMALLNCKKVCCVQENLFFNLFREDSLCHSFFSEKYLTEFIVLDKLIEDTNKLNLNKEDKTEILNIFNCLVYYSRITMAKRIAKDFKILKFKKKVKEYIVKTDVKYKDVKKYLCKRAKFETMVYNFSKILFACMCKIYYKFQLKS